MPGGISDDGDGDGGAGGDGAEAESGRGVQSPKTGDESALVLWLALAFGALGVAVSCKRRKQSR